MWNRSKDLIITIIQDNINYELKINNLSSNLTNILGYQHAEIINKSMFDILTALSREYIMDNIDFQENDLGFLFSKLTKLTLLTKYNDEIEMIVKAYFINKINNKLEFKLLLESQEINKNLLLLKTNVKTIIQQCQFLVNVKKEITTLQYILHATINYINEVKPKQSNVLIIFEITNAIDLLVQGNSYLVENIVEIISRNIRKDDIILKLSEDQFALILLETNSPDLEKIIGRLIRVVMKDSEPNAKTLFNVGCSYINKDDNPEKIIQNCLRSIRKSSFSGGNKLVIHNYYKNKEANNYF